MNKPKFSAAALFLICLLSFSVSYAQTQEERQTEASYEVILQILVASENGSAKGELPANLSAAVSKLKNNFSYTDYRLVSTNLQRIGSAGNVSHKSMLDELLDNSGDTVFSEWSLNGLRQGNDLKGGKSVGFQSFNFGARLPVKSLTFNQDAKAIPATNYEQIGISLYRFSVPENIPTLIGTLAVPKSNELIFFVLTVKPAE